MNKQKGISKESRSTILVLNKEHFLEKNQQIEN